MKKIWLGWIASLMLSLGAGFVMEEYFDVNTILRIQFATSAGDMAESIRASAPTAEESYRLLLRNTVVDYIFLLGYTFLALLSVRIILDALEIGTKKGLYILALIPGVLDAIENAFLIKTAINRHEEISWLYMAVVRIKWAVSIVPLMVIPMVIIYGLVILLHARQGPDNRKLDLAELPGVSKKFRDN